MEVHAQGLSHRTRLTCAIDTCIPLLVQRPGLVVYPGRVCWKFCAVPVQFGCAPILRKWLAVATTVGSSERYVAFVVIARQTNRFCEWHTCCFDLGRFPFVGFRLELRFTSPEWVWVNELYESGSKHHYTEFLSFEGNLVSTWQHSIFIIRREISEMIHLNWYEPAVWVADTSATTCCFAEHLHHSYSAGFFVRVWSPSQRLMVV